MPEEIRQPLEIRVFHWLFFAVVTVKLWSGFAISFPDPLWLFPNLYAARLAHATMTPLLAALLAFRLYYALLVRDWRQILFFRPVELVELWSWLRYLFFLDNLKPPDRGKYNPVQRLFFTFILLTMALFFTTGVVMLDLNFFRWVNLYFGGQGPARAIHYLTAVFLAAAVALHVYLAVTSSTQRLKAMLCYHIQPCPQRGEKK